MTHTVRPNQEQVAKMTTDYEALAHFLDAHAEVWDLTPAKGMLKQAAAALRKVSDEKNKADECIDDLAAERDKLIEAGAALHRRTMHQIVVLEAERTGLAAVVSGIANANRWDRSVFDNDDAFVAWAQSLCKHANHLAAHDMAAELRAEREREDRLLLADWHHSVKDGMHVWRAVLNLGVPGHWSDGSTLIEVIDADRATAARLAEERLDAPPPA